MVDVVLEVAGLESHEADERRRLSGGADVVVAEGLVNKGQSVLGGDALFGISCVVAVRGSRSDGEKWVDSSHHEGLGCRKSGGPGDEGEKREEEC